MRSRSRIWLLAFVLLLLLPGSASAEGTRLLVFSGTAGFRHDSIPSAIEAVEGIAQERGWDVQATEDPAELSAENLAMYDAVVFLMTTGDILSDAEQAALEGFIRAGGGWAGVHSASDTEYDWPWYGELVGAYFDGHPAPQNATVRVLDRDHPATRELPAQWGRFDEWYNFSTNPRGAVHVLATLDERSYEGGTMGADHPVAWCHEFDGGRAFYTAGGHTSESYDEPEFLDHLAGGLAFAAGAAAGDCGATIEGRFEKVVLETDVHEPMELSVAADGRVFFIERGGRLRFYDPARALTIEAATLDVHRDHEDGLLGLALDPAFQANDRIYLYYSPAGPTAEQRLSRFRMAGDTLDLASEEVLLTVATQREQCCHSGGSLAFDSEGHLFLSAGDNTNPFASDGSAPIDERAGWSAWDAQGTSGNPDDLRGKILRVTPEEGGGLSIPDGNLFPADGSAGRPEIYAMGLRNPFRISVDPVTGVLYWGEVGPDAGEDGARGPRGYDEVNRAPTAGNFGWPYCIADNRPYNDHDFETGETFGAFDCGAPVNDSINNTGARELPAARPAWIWYPYGPSAEFPEIGEGGRTIMAGPVYHFDPLLPSATKLPAYYDRSLFIYEWTRNWIKEVKLDEDGTILGILPFLPGMSFVRPMDLEVGPDGSLYLIEYGTGWGDNDDAQVVRIDYPGGRFTPTAMASANPSSGPVPLQVQFSSVGSVDPEGDPLHFSWDFDADGSTDSTDEFPLHVYEQPGRYQAQLTVTDGAGHGGVTSVTVVAGNTAPRVMFELPVPGGFYTRDEHVHFRVRVEDAEDGTTDDCIACEDVLVQPAVGHDDHAHPQIEQRRCEGSFVAEMAEDPAQENLYYVLTARYTDRGAPGSAPLTTTAGLRLQPKRHQAEFFSDASGVEIEPTGDSAGGARNIGFIDTGEWTMYEDMDLEGIESLTLRAASAGLGGRVEVHADAPEGPLLATVPVGLTGDWQVYQDVTAPIVDPDGMHDLYFAFLGDGGGLFNINWIDFVGPGISSAEPPVVPEPGPVDDDCPEPEDPLELVDGGAGADGGSPEGDGDGDSHGDSDGDAEGLDGGGCSCRAAASGTRPDLAGAALLALVALRCAGRRSRRLRAAPGRRNARPVH